VGASADREAPLRLRGRELVSGLALRLKAGAGTLLCFDDENEDGGGGAADTGGRAGTLISCAGIGAGVVEIASGMAAVVTEAARRIGGGNI